MRKKEKKITKMKGAIIWVGVEDLKRIKNSQCPEIVSFEYAEGLIQIIVDLDFLVRIFDDCESNDVD